MGNSTKGIVYSVPINLKSQKPGQSKIHRHPDSVISLLQMPEKGIDTLQAIWLSSLKTYAKIPYLGTQVKKGEAVDYSYESYAQVDAIARRLGSEIKSKEYLAHATEGKVELDMIGIFSKNRKEWLYADIASILYKFQLVPLYDTLGLESIDYILDQTQMTSCFVTEGTLKTLLKVKNLSKLKSLITFDQPTQDISKQVEERGLSLLFLGDLLKNTEVLPIEPVKPTDCYTFSYTSGSVSFPKGVMLSQGNFTAICAGFLHDKELKLTTGQKHISYLPLPHVMERAACCLLMSCGGTICFYGGDVQTLKKDLSLVKPQIFVSVPRLFCRFYDVIKARFDETQGISKQLLDRALATKLDRLRRYGTCTHSIYDRLIFNKTKEAFGGNLRMLISGSAPLSGEIIQFLKIVSCSPLIEGYGQTESTAVSFATSMSETSTGHVGGPFRTVQFKVQDIPDMNCFSTDSTDGQNTPRGQICIRGPTVFMGYFRLPEKTEEALDKDGWLHTGDVGMILPNGALKIIDRKKNIFKLQQGEYVAPEKIQNSYTRITGINEVFLHGQSLQSFTVAVVVPDPAYIKRWADQNKISASHQELCQNKDLRLKVLSDLTAQGKKDGLTGFEQAKNVYLQHSNFLERGCFTNTMKLKRFEAKKIYSKELEAMYKEGFLK